jgi:hypothetical protein
MPEGPAAVRAVGRGRRRADRPPQQRSAQAAHDLPPASSVGMPETPDFIGRTWLGALRGVYSNRRRASFFDVDVCSLARKGEQTQPGGKREDGAGGRWACRRDRLHRFSRDSFAGAACAGPKAQTRSLATRAKTCARRRFRGSEARTTAIVAVKRRGTAAPERRQMWLAARSAGAGLGFDGRAATSDSKSSARRNT